MTNKVRQRYLERLAGIILAEKEAKQESYHLRREDPYLKSGAWQCPQSPTGAHHWIITGEMMKCKYCPEERRVERWSQPRPKVKRIKRIKHDATP